MSEQVVDRIRTNHVAETICKSLGIALDLTEKQDFMVFIDSVKANNFWNEDSTVDEIVDVLEETMKKYYLTTKIKNLRVFLRRIVSPILTLDKVIGFAQKQL